MKLFPEVHAAVQRGGGRRRVSLPDAGARDGARPIHPAVFLASLLSD
jgi:hypothetical protein